VLGHMGSVRTDTHPHKLIQAIERIIICCRCCVVVGRPTSRGRFRETFGETNSVVGFIWILGIRD
jgi:hypothetical protein